MDFRFLQKVDKKTQFFCKNIFDRIDINVVHVA